MGDFLKKSLNESLSPNEVGVEEKLGIGMETTQADITDRDPQLDEKERASLTEPWKAEQTAKAMQKLAEATKKKTITESEGTRQRKINESEGDAQAIINNIIAVKNDEEIGKMLVEYNAWKESAKAGGATFFFGDNRGGSKDLDPIVFAKLEEIRKQLAGKADKSEAMEPEVKPTGNKKKGGKK